MPAAESFPKRATVCGRQKSVTLPEERRRFAALLRPLSWLPKKPESQPPTESLQDEKRVGHKREEQDTPVAATRSRTPMPQDFTMCDASRICCESVWRFGSFFLFFLIFTLFCIGCLLFFWLIFGCYAQKCQYTAKIHANKHGCVRNLYITHTPCMVCEYFSTVHTYHGVLVLGRVCANWPRVSGQNV